MKQKIYNIVTAILALLLLGEEAREYTAQTTPQAYTIAPELPTRATQRNDTERMSGESRYWHLYATYEVTDTTAGTAAVPGGQQYTYRYTHPKRQTFFQDTQPNIGDISFVPPALRNKEIEVVQIEITQRGR